MKTEKRAIGCLVGLALGDAYGAPYEGGVAERLLWRLMGRTRHGLRRWTDDTAMSLAVAASLTAAGGVDQDDLARRFADGYRWTRGYGPGAARVLKQIRRGRRWQDAASSVYRGGSYGNGAAMRSPVVAIAYSGDVLRRAVEDVAVITHGHPLAIEGAGLVATAVDHALQGADPGAIFSQVVAAATQAEYRQKLEVARSMLSQRDLPAASEIRATLGCSVTALESCATGIVIGLLHADRPFEELLSMAIGVGGDVDTIGAMGASIWGAIRGADALPAELRQGLESNAEIERVASALYARFHGPAR